MAKTSEDLAKLEKELNDEITKTGDRVVAWGRRVQQLHEEVVTPEQIDKLSECKRKLAALDPTKPNVLVP